MGKKLYVGNLPYSATEETLRSHFGAVGAVESVQIIVDRESGRSKGFGFVTMMSDDDANSAISQFDGQQFEGRPLTVNEARPRPEGSGGGGGGGFRGGGGGGGRGGRGGGRGDFGGRR